MQIRSWKSKNTRISLMIRTYFIFLLCSLSLACYANNEWDTYKVRAINNQDKLPGMQINQILQDSEGYMWFATDNGLCRYDGYTLKTYKSSNQTPRLLQSNNITTIIEDIDKRIWIGTEQGINILDTSNNQITSIDNDHLSNSYIHSFLLTSDSTLWIGTQVGLLEYHRENQSFTTYRNRPNDTTSICGNSIKALKEDAAGNIWVATYGYGICKLDTQKKIFIQYPAVSLLNRTNCLLEDTNNHIWVCNWGDGITKIQNSNNPTDPNYKRIETSTEYECIFHCIEQLPDGDILVGSNQGLHLIDKSDQLIAKNTQQNPIHTLVANEDILDLYIDKNNSIWIGTRNAGVFIAYLEKTPFTNFPINSTIDSKQPLKVNAFYEWDEDILLLGIEKVSFAFFHKKSKTIINYREIENYRNMFKQWPGNLQFIFKHPDKDELWLGTQYGGLIICQIKDHKIVSTQYHVNHLGNTPIGASISTIIRDQKQNIWIGSDEGLNIITANGDTLSHKTYNRIQTLLQDHTGAMWLGTYFDGIYRLRPGFNINKMSFEIYNTKNKLISSNEIMCIYEDSNQNLWVGTKGSGLQKYNREKNCFDPIPQTEDIPGDIIFNITEFNDDLILGTNQGLVIYNSTTHKSIVLDERDGMLDKTCQKNAVLNTGKGEIYYGTSKGFYIFCPELVDNDSASVKTVISDLKIFHKSFDELPEKKQKQLAGYLHPLHTKNITLSSSDNNLGIEFAALSYIHPEKRRYAYMLEGFDKDWIYTGAAQRTAYYTNLPAGKYKFLVKSINFNKIESVHNEEFYIKVLPPIYQSGYAYMLYFILTVLAIYLFYRFQLYRFRLQEAIKTEQIERIKSEELNQSKLRFFTNISHEFLTPLSIISCTFEELRRKFNINNQTVKAAEANVFRLNKLIEEILEFQKAENNKLRLQVSYGDIGLFIHNICCENFSLLVKSKEITLDIVCTPTHIPAWFDADKIDKVLYNLLSNAVKYSYTDGKGKIEIEVIGEGLIDDFQYNNLRIKVRNLGKGIEPDKLPHIFSRFYENSPKNLTHRGNGIGLALTKSLVELHNGTIEVSSDPGEWTEFIVCIPINKTAFSNRQFQQADLEEKTINPSQSISERIEEKDTSSTDSATERPKHSLLLIEDDLELRNSLKQLLANKYAVTAASNGLEGLETANLINPDIIISDVMMPEMDGFELCNRIKEDINTSHIPVILLTAKIDTHDYLTGLKQGADVYIKKPFSVSLLEAQIETILLNRQRMVEKIRANPLNQNFNLSISSYEEKFLKKAIDIVKENMENPLFDVKQFLELMGVSNSMLYRKLKALTDLSPNEFIRNARLKAATELMQQQKGNISDIAYQVGFNDARYFSTCFKKEFKMTPGEYMKQFEV